MFDWMPYVGAELTALSDTGNTYYIRPLNEKQPAGPWMCSGLMADGTDYKLRKCTSRRSAEAYAEELEIQAEC